MHKLRRAFMLRCIKLCIVGNNTPSPPRVINTVTGGLYIWFNKLNCIFMFSKKNDKYVTPKTRNLSFCFKQSMFTRRHRCTAIHRQSKPHRILLHTPWSSWMQTYWLGISFVFSIFSLLVWLGYVYFQSFRYLSMLTFCPCDKNIKMKNSRKEKNLNRRCKYILPNKPIPQGYVLELTDGMQNLQWPTHRVMYRLCSTVPY